MWRLFHRIIASNSYISKLNETVLPICPFCIAKSIVSVLDSVHSLFELLGEIIVKLGFSFTNSLFILGCRYRKSWQQQCTLDILLIGQAKLAIFKTHQCKNAGEDVSMVSLFKSLVKCVYLYMYKIIIYSTHKYISLCKHRLLFWMRLIAINFCTSLVFNW